MPNSFSLKPDRGTFMTNMSAHLRPVAEAAIRAYWEEERRDDVWIGEPMEPDAPPAFSLHFSGMTSGRDSELFWRIYRRKEQELAKGKVKP